MLRSDLVKLLNSLPDLPVGNDQAEMAYNASVTSYDDDEGTHDYIEIEFLEDGEEIDEDNIDDEEEDTFIEE